MGNCPVNVPAEWRSACDEVSPGRVMVLGGVDSGKTTLVRWLADRLTRRGRSVAVLDGDPGQSTYGVPTTVTLRTHRNEEFHWFVGSTSPRGNMLSLVTGAGRLAERMSGEDVLVCDTTGLVDPSAGGQYLKRSLLDLIRTDTVIALPRGDELNPIIEPLRRNNNMELIELSPSEHTRHKDQQERRDNRRQQYRNYFRGSEPIPIDHEECPVWPEVNFIPHQIVALCDEEGFAADLGLVVGASDGTVTLKTPRMDSGGIEELRRGEVTVDPTTWEDSFVEADEF